MREIVIIALACFLIGIMAAALVGHFVVAWLPVRRSTMLRITIYAILVVILMMGAASAHNDLHDIQGGENSMRTEQEKKNDRELDRVYESTIKRRPDAKQNSDPWADVRSAPPAAAKNKQK